MQTEPTPLQVRQHSQRFDHFGVAQVGAGGLLDMIESRLASASGFFDTTSLITAKAINSKEPTSANNPSQGLNRKITSR